MPLEVADGGAPPATLAENIYFGLVPIELLDTILYYLCIPSSVLLEISLRLWDTFWLLRVFFDTPNFSFNSLSNLKCSSLFSYFGRFVRIWLFWKPVLVESKLENLAWEFLTVLISTSSVIFMIWLLPADNGNTL